MRDIALFEIAWQEKNSSSEAASPPVTRSTSLRLETEENSVGS
jgi:hypothetical protein